jgi:hypothetical protein
MPADQVSLGVATFEFRSMIASALTNCGAGPFVPIQASFRDHKRSIIAVLSFDARVIYYPGSEHRAQAEIIVSRPLQSSQGPPHDELYDPRFGDQVQSSGRSASSVSSHFSGSSSVASDLIGSHASIADARRANQAQLEQVTARMSSSGTLQKENSAGSGKRKSSSGNGRAEHSAGSGKRKSWSSSGTLEKEKSAESGKGKSSSGNGRAGQSAPPPETQPRSSPATVPVEEEEEEETAEFATDFVDDGY